MGEPLGAARDMRGRGPSRIDQLALVPEGSAKSRTGRSQALGRLLLLKKPEREPVGGFVTVPSAREIGLVGRDDESLEA